MQAVRDRRATRWEHHRRTRRAELTDAAIAAIRRHGAGVGMDDVAAAARTSKTAVYRHFADRNQLYVAVCERVAEVLLAQVRAAIDGVAGPRAKTAAAISAYLRLIENDPEVYRFVVHRPLAEADLVADLVSVIGDQVAEVIAEHLTAAGADPSPAVPWGHGVVGMVRAAADNWIARPAGMSREQLADHLTALAWAGLSGVVARSEEETP